MNAGTILVDRYQVCELLSHKAGRLTLLARDLHSQELTIVKILSFDRDFEWDSLKLFEREAATLKHLDCPEIPKYLDYFEIDTADIRGFALVQSYIDAPSLQTLINQGRKFTEAEVIELADRLLNILAYLHQQHPPVIHRDIKPSNILLGNRSGNSVGDVYLVDFGSVQTLASKEGGTITIVGSYGYIPLEQFGGQTTAASDLYSLGMTLIYLLTGTHPAELPQVDGRVQFSAQISKPLERWLAKMTQPHLDRRFDRAQVARVALQSQDGTYGDFQALKPVNTKIKLYRDRDKLEIVWQDPKPGLSTEAVEYIHIVIGVAIWLLELLVCIFTPRSIYESPHFLFIAICFHILCLSLFVFLTNLFDSSIEKNHLLIDSHFIDYFKVNNKGELTTYLSKHPRSQSETAIYNPGYTFNKCINTKGEIMAGKSTTIQPKLDLFSGSFEYSFPQHFSQRELWWLGKELSDFLNLELQVIYPAQLKIPGILSLQNANVSSKL